MVAIDAKSQFLGPLVGLGFLAPWGLGGLGWLGYEVCGMHLSQAFTRWPCSSIPLARSMMASLCGGPHPRARRTPNKFLKGADKGAPRIRHRVRPVNLRISRA